MPARTNLVTVQGIQSVYTSKASSTKLDVSCLTGICYLTPDTDKALHDLNVQVRLQGGCLYVSDLFRSWVMQEAAYDDWKAGRRTDYAAPAGHSFHSAGRAIDIDTQHLSFACPKSEWLSRFWSIASPLGWSPIVNMPDASLNESWHFQYLGADWRHLVGKLEDGEIAKCAILDAGQWDTKDVLLPILSLQAQCNRLSNRPGMPQVLVMDGRLGPKTSAFLTALLGASWTVQTAMEMLIQL